MTMTSECGEVEALLQARLDGECIPEEVTRVDGHLESCAACQEAWGELEQLVGHLQAMYARCEEAAPAISVPGVPSGAALARAEEELRASQAPTLIPGSTTALGAAQLDASAEALVGSGYRIEAPIARGGFGAVYRAVQLSLDRPVALKLLAPHLADNPEFVARFLREAKVAAALHHPNLVAIYDVGQQGKQLYYAMELVEGTDLEAVIKQEGFVPPRRAAEIASGVARALEAAAKAGIVHRDVKPANVLLTREGGVKLADLGLAKAAEAEDGTGNLTLKKKVIGSPNYMSPEQAQDIRTATPRSDVYSLGATLLHVLSGRVPFGTGSPVEVLARVLRDPPEVPELLPSGEKLDPALRGLLLRALAKDPAQRPDAAGLAAALDAWLAGEQLPAEVAAAPGGGGSAAAPGRSASGRRGQTGRKQRQRSSSDRTPLNSDSSARLAVHRGGATSRPRQPSWSMGLAAAAVLLVGVGVVIALRKGEAGPETAAQPVPSAPAPRTSPRDTTPPPRRVSDVQKQPVKGPAREPRRPESSPREAEAEAALQDLQRWIAANPDQTGERWRRARELAQAFPGSAAASQAGDTQRQAEEDLARSLEAAQGLSESLEAQDRLGEARDALLAFLERSGEDAPQGVQARVLLSALEAKLDVKLEGDLSRLDTLLAQGSVDEARTLAEKVRGYAGGIRGALAQEKVDGYLAKNPQPGQPGEGQALAEAPKDPMDGDKPGEAGSAKETEGRALLARARSAMDKKEWASAREALKKVRELGKVPALADELDELTVALDKALTPPEAGVLLAAWLRGEVKSLGGARIEARYDFDDEAEAEDWIAAEGFEGQSAQLQEALEGLIKPPSGLKEPWTVKRGALAAYGWSRRRFAAAFRTDEPVKIEVKAKGPQNVIVAFQDPGKARSALVGVNYLLDELPLNQIATDVWKGGGRGGGGELARRVGEMKKRIDQSRKRGPALVLIREDGLLNHDELQEQAMSVSRSPAFAVELRPDGKNRHVVVISVGRKELPPIELEEPDAIWLTLASLGSPVAWDEVTVTGTVREDVLERLRNVAKEVGAEPEALRKKLREDAADKARQEEERKKAEEERRRQRREGGMGGNDGEGDKGEGDKGEGDKGEGEKKDDGKR